MEYAQLVHPICLDDLYFIELENLLITHWQSPEIVPINQGCHAGFIQSKQNILYRTRCCIERTMVVQWFAWNNCAKAC